MAEMMVGSALMSATGGASAVGLVGAAGTFAPMAGSIAAGLSGFGGTLLTGLSVGSSLMGAFSSMDAGNMQAQTLRLQAQQSELSSRQALLRGRQQSTAIKQQLERDMAGAAATFAARGVYAGEGSADAAMMQSKDNATQDINNVMFGARQDAITSKITGAGYRTDAKAAKVAGYSRAAQGVAKAGMTLLEGM